MFYSSISSIFRIFYEINDFKETNLLSGTRKLSDMFLLRLCGYTSNSEEIMIK